MAATLNRYRRKAEVNDTHHVVGPSPTYGVCEDATKDQTKGVPERLAHPVHGKSGVAPWTLGEGVGDESFSRGLAHRYSYTQKYPEEDRLDIRLGEPRGYVNITKRKLPVTHISLGPMTSATAPNIRSKYPAASA